MRIPVPIAEYVVPEHEWNVLNRDFDIEQPLIERNGGTQQSFARRPRQIGIPKRGEEQLLGRRPNDQLKALRDLTRCESTDQCVGTFEQLGHKRQRVKRVRRYVAPIPIDVPVPLRWTLFENANDTIAIKLNVYAFVGRVVEDQRDEAGKIESADIRRHKEA